MNNNTQRILELIQNNLTINEISEILGLSHKQLYHYLVMLNNMGYGLVRKYYYDGNIKYNLNQEFDTNDEISIITPHDLNRIEFLVISDIHLSSSKERLDLIDRVYNYCIVNNIHLTLIAGDIIDGFVGHLPRKFNTAREQIEYCIKTYPFDKNILNFLVLGNHDYSTLVFEGQDLGKALCNRRHDIVVTGYGEGKIHIKNDFILLRHPLKFVKTPTEIYTRKLIIKGHTHRFKIWTDYDNSIIYAPTLSDINNEGILPGAIHMKLNLLNGYIQKCYLTNLTYFNDKFYTTGEGEIYFNGKTFQGNREIKNEEEMVKVLKK